NDILSGAEASVFPAFLKKELLQRNQPVLFYMKSRQSKVFNPFKIAAEWFERDFIILLPNSKPNGFAMLLSNKIVYDFTLDLMRTKNKGIIDIKLKTTPAEEYFGQDDNRVIDVLTSELKATSTPWKHVREDAPDAVFIIESNKPVVKKVVFYHIED